MARNTYFTMSAEDIKTFASTAATVLGGLVYAIPAADMTALNSAVTGLTASITAGQVATVAFHSAIADKRRRLLPVAGRWSLDELAGAIPVEIPLELDRALPVATVRAGTVEPHRQTPQELSLPIGDGDDDLPLRAGSGLFLGAEAAAVDHRRGGD